MLAYPPRPLRLRTQLESFMVLRRNPLELWGPAAYREFLLKGSFFGRPQLLVSSPAAIQHILVANAANYRRSLPTRRVLQPLLGESLFLAEGEAWRHRRRTIAPAMAPRAMPMLISHMRAAGEHFLAELRQHGFRPLELLPRLQTLALTVAASSMFSVSVNDDAMEVRALLQEYGAQAGRVGIFDLLLPERWNGPGDRLRNAFAQRWRALLDRIIERRAAVSAPDTPRDLFDLLLAARDPETGQPFSAGELRDEISTMMIAGHETTAITLFWACLLAALHPTWQAELNREARAALAASTLPALQATPCLRAHVDETLRLYPPAFLIVRQARAPDLIEEMPIDAGTIVSIAPWVLHRHRRLWQEPDRFRPQRFLPPAPPPARHAYLPFGAGPRICIGAQFAITEAVLLLTMILGSFRLTVPEGTAVLPRGQVTTQPDRSPLFLLDPL
jgi:cytochrome P450